LAEDSKDEKNLLTGLNLHYVDAMALNDDEKGLSIELFGFYLLDDLLGIRKMQSLSFSKKFVRRFPKTIFDDALSLLQRLMADFRSSKRT